MPTPPQALPTILFGAFDRHNLGDLLFPHVAARLLAGSNLHFATLVERDLRSAGGYETQSITKLAEELGKQPINLLHVGGELLTCDAWQAAVMVQAPEQVQRVIKRLESRAAERHEWVHDVLRLTEQAPYLVRRKLFPGPCRLIYTAVGGVELNERDESFRAEVISKIRDADYVSVRDQQTWEHLKYLGIHAHLAPDPAVLVAELFGEQIETCSHSGEVAATHAAFPQGYIAFQFSADFGDDATLIQIAAQLDQLVEASGFGIVLFRAGAAPWHDELACYRHLVELMNSTQTKVFESLNIWDICALISNSCAYCGSSLHGRIVAMAFALPRVNLCHPHRASRTGKQAAYAATWELRGIPLTTSIAGIAAAMQTCLNADREQLCIHARTLTAKYLEEFTTIRALLNTPKEDMDEIPKRH